MSFRLTQNTLPKYFTIADINTSWHEEAINTFDFVDRNSDHLLVTVGDSWTYGSQLEGDLDDQNERRTEVYGGIIAKNLSCDWLNLGLNAQGNFWMADRVEELANIIPKLNYKHIDLIIVFTGVSRWFNTNIDAYVNYGGWFKEISNDFDELFSKLNRECVHRILKAIKPFDNVRLKIGTNICEACGFEELENHQVIEQPWYTLLTDYKFTEPMYHCQWYDRLPTAIDWVADEHKKDFNQWLENINTQYYARWKILDQSNLFFNHHPTSYGHQLWANYVTKNL